jgi:hypothetical protein
MSVGFWRAASRAERWLAGASLLLACAVFAGAGDAPRPIVIDDFTTVSSWKAFPADGVDLAIAGDAGEHGGAMRLDFHFKQGGGYAVARKAVDLSLPENYAFSFRIRGEAPSNHVEFKLIDATGENVWWSVRRDFSFPRDWQTFRIKKRQISFAWGPLGGGEIREVKALEIVVTAGSGGQGSVWIDDLELTPLPPPDAKPPTPVARASSALRGHDAARVLDRDSTTTWRPAAKDRAPWIALDLGDLREYGGLVLDWAPEGGVGDYVIEGSTDGRAWTALRTVTGGNGGRDYLYLPESESRHVRVRLTGDPAATGRAALAAVTVEPLAWSATREAFFQAIAADAPRGLYPRGMSGEQSYWTVVGADNDRREVLFSEDGAIEAGEEHFSIEPFLRVGDQLLTWNDGTTTQRFASGAEGVAVERSAWDPMVIRAAPPLNLTTHAFASGESGKTAIIVEYQVFNSAPEPIQATLYLAIRPFQVNPPAQALNHPGGTAPIRDLSFDGRTVRANGQAAIYCFTPGAEFGAATFDQGDIVAEHMEQGSLPESTTVHDDFGAASGVLVFPMNIRAASRTVLVGNVPTISIVIPLYAESPPPPTIDRAPEQWNRQMAPWRSSIERTRVEPLDPTRLSQLEGHDSAKLIFESVESQLVYILVNRAGPAIQPGTRSYARSWIRDGSLTSTALLRLGHADAVKEFIEWFAPYQYPNGKIPCVVDWRGADPVPEHDSSGEFIYLVAEYYRHTQDRSLIEQMWPRVSAAAGYLDSLRHECRTKEFEAPEMKHFYGLLPPSISHEGYSAKPMHSYWDDFFAYLGFKDATFLAKELGRADEAKRLAAIRDEFATDLAASVEAARRVHNIDYIPGCADLGDEDATSTTIAFAPTDAAAILNQDALRRTFERYWEFFTARRDGAAWDAFTPYEMRAIGAFVRLGWRDRAQELLTWFMSQQKPIGWRQWPEVVFREDRVPHFIGDLPHTWVGSDFVRSVLDMLAYEREEDESLVLGAGVPLEWLRDPGISVRNLSTHYGPLSFTMQQVGTGVEVKIEAGTRIPPGGIAVQFPLQSIGKATINGKRASAKGGEIIVRELPATVLVGPES